MLIAEIGGLEIRVFTECMYQCGFLCKRTEELCKLDICPFHTELKSLQAKYIYGVKT
jgi:hypothetical protein